MDQFMKGLYGTTDEDDDQVRVSKATDFVSRVESGNKAEGYSTEEAVQNYKNVTSGLSDEEFESVAADALNQLTPDQRREFTHVIKEQAGIDLDDNLDDPQQLAALTKQFRSQSGGDMGGLLGGLLGGGGGSSDDIMGMLGGLFGGGGTGGMGATGTGTTSQAGISGLLGNPIVKMVLGLIAAAAMKRMMGGGGQPAQSATIRPSSGSQGDSGGGGILDALFGGGDDNPAAERSRQDRNQGDQGGGGFLDALFGGGDDNDDKGTRTSRGKKVDVSRIEADRKKKGI